ncbi:unnamed protein product [Cylindrotheca closterium]|uniref:G-protein coupled receptors family 3 profile domain-containing protein n=1 Tax=Cylindrotheca closterium TaxID=2856 RepID=A0AAD2CGE1_9STRA|nr:unnamed protein product [Cylindrotheca closterium]
MKLASPSRSLLLCLIIIFFTSCFTSEVQSQPVLNTLRDYDLARSQALEATRIQSITVSDGVPYADIAMLIPFSIIGDNGRQAVKEGGYQGMAAVLLALEHLNTGNGTLVKEVGGLDERCNIKFTTEVRDTTRSEMESLNHAVEMTSRDEATELPTAFVGAFRSAVSIATSLVTGLRGIPQISPISTSSQLDNVAQFPLFGRTVPSDDGTAVPAIKYLRQKLKVRYLAILHINDSYGNAYAAGMQRAAALYAPDMTIQAFDLPLTLTAETVESAIAVLKSTGYQYFFGIFFTRQYEMVMTEAYAQGIAGDGKHNWMFSDAVSTIVTLEGFVADSPLHLATQGAVQISAVGGVPGRDERYDLFLRAMRDLNNPVDIATLQSYHPIYPDEPEYSTYTIEEDPNGFFDLMTIGLVPFLYDAAIALGLAACNIENDENEYFDGYQHFEKFKETEFQGASGNNRFDPETGTRLADSARFSLTNFVHVGTIADTASFNNVETDIFQDGEWISVKSRIFNDGTTIPPPGLPPVVPANLYIGRSLRSVGLVLAGAILTLSIGFTIWMVRYRKTRVVKASQPIFLGIIALGCFLMGTSIVFLSLDDEVVSAETCSAFCILTPWFFSFGWVLSFSALFAKTQRVNKIFHSPKFHRMKVTVKDVMAPMIVLQTLSNLILILWYIYAKPMWIRETTKEDSFGREIETRAFCSYAGSIGFAVSLGTLLLGVLGYTLQQAYAARNVSTEFAETEYIFLALAALLLVSFVGFPVLVIAKDDTQARFYVSAAIIAVTSLSILLLIFVPKIAAKKRRRRASSAGVLEFTSRTGSRKFKISGLHPRRNSHIGGGFQEPPKIEQEILESGDNDSSSDSDDDKEGVAVVQHPRAAEKLKETVEELQSWNTKLIAQVARLEALHRKTHARLNMATRPHDSANLGESSSTIRHPFDDSARSRGPSFDQSIKPVPNEDVENKTPSLQEAVKDV